VLYFAGNDGFYSTNGYEIIKLSKDISNTYRSLTVETQQKLDIYGAFDSLNDRIWWAVQADLSSQDNDTVFILDLTFTSGENGVFTTLGNSDSFVPTSLVFFLIRRCLEVILVVIF
jgi:hypothetical protein